MGNQLGVSMKDYRGKIVFLERKDPAKSNYGGGEFIVIEQSPNNLFGVKPEAGYGSHAIEAKPMVGIEAWSVVSESNDPKFLQRFVKDLRYFGETIKRGDKTNWMPSVYEGALRVAQKLEALVCDCNGEAPVSAITAKTHSFFLNGHRVTVSIDS